MSELKVRFTSMFCTSPNECMLAECGGCCFHEIKEKFICGDYKKIDYNGYSLKFGNKSIQVESDGTWYDEWIDYLEIDKKVYINNDGEEEQTERNQIDDPGLQEIKA